MFKTNSDIITIEAKTTEPISTEVVFWSHDKGTAKLIFHLKKDSIEQTIPKGTIIPICLEFNSKTANNGRGRHVYHSTIEDAIKGIVSIVLEDNILGYVGRVDGSIYIELPDSRSLDTAGRFTFDIKRSPIDEIVPELEDYYWQGFDIVMDRFYTSINLIESETKQSLAALSAGIESAQKRLLELDQDIKQALIDFQNGNFWTKEESFDKDQSTKNVIDQIKENDEIDQHLQSQIENDRVKSIATKEEAEEGSSAAKLMTPQTTKQVMEKQSVLLIGDQEIDGKKEFKLVPEVNGKRVLTTGNLPTQDALWSGSSFMSSAHTITLSKNIADCLNGIVLKWNPYNSSSSSPYTSQSNYSFIPKQHVSGVSSGQSVLCPIFKQDGTFVGAKVVTISPVRITGADVNAIGALYGYVLTGAYEV